MKIQSSISFTTLQRLLFSSFARATSNTTKAVLLLLAVMVAGSAAEVHGQSALDGFDPNANGTIYAVVVQPDGKILIGGDFTTLSPNGEPPVTRNHIARLNTDGTLDTGFDPDINGTVLSIAVQTDGKILVGGDFFTSVGGVPRMNIARLETSGAAEVGFDPTANSKVLSIAVQTDGKILIGGEFTTLAPNLGPTVARNRMARLNPDGMLDGGFDPNATGGIFTTGVSAIAVQVDGKILIGGDFTTLAPNGGASVTRNFIARLEAANGAVDAGFDPNPNYAVFSIAVQANGKILVGGGFATLAPNGGATVTRHNIARLQTSGAVDAGFDPNANGFVYSIAVQADGRILLVGGFSALAPNGGASVARFYIARIEAANGALDAVFNPHANNAVFAIAVQADGKTLVGGQFATLSPNDGDSITRSRIARLETDGRVDQTLNNPGIVGSTGVVATAVQPDGKILIGGDFTSVLGVPRNNIARLNPDGTLDTAFNPNANDELRSIAVQADGKILAGGFFTNIGGQTRNRIARLNPDGTLDTTFNPNANNHVYPILVQKDGKILVGGLFTSLSPNGGGASTRNRIARLNPDGTLDTTFDPNANNSVFAIAVQPNDKILVGGLFTTLSPNGGIAVTRNRAARLNLDGTLDPDFNPNANSMGVGVGVVVLVVQANGILAGGDFTVIGGQPRNRIARLDAINGLADMSFNPNANNEIRTIALQADGKILVGGFFTSIGGQARGRLARIDTTTGLPDSFNGGANTTVWSIALQADGKVLAGGAFSSIGGQTRSRFARLSNDTVALQNLAVAPTTITWTRGGSSPELARVTFESSTDNVNYTPLGNGTEAGSNWTLTGLSLTTGQNYYIRARGYYHTGYEDGSESITESVRNAFIPASSCPGIGPTYSAVSRKNHGACGMFDIPLPQTYPFGTECRSGGPNGNYQIVLTFSSPVIYSDVVVKCGIGTVVSSTGSGTNTVTINLTGVTDAQVIKLTLVCVDDGVTSGNVEVKMGILLGDTNGNGCVNASDKAQTAAQIGPVTASNFREDVNASCSINATDVALVKSKSGVCLVDLCP